MPLDLENVQSGYNLAVINENFQRIEDSWDEKLDRVNSGSFYNQMEQELDMNSNHVINNPAPTEETHLVRLKELNDLVFNSGATGVIPLVQPRQVGDGSTTVFAAPNNNVVSAATMFISIDGVMQRPFTDYDVLAANQVTFTEAVPNLATIDITYFEPSVIENPDVSLRTAKATGTSEARTLGDRFADVVRAEDFGVVPGTVDITKFKTALASSNSRNKPLVFTSGVYDFNNQDISNGGLTPGFDIGSFNVIGEGTTFSNIGTAHFSGVVKIKGIHYLNCVQPVYMTGTMLDIDIRDCDFDGCVRSIYHNDTAGIINQGTIKDNHFHDTNVDDFLGGILLNRAAVVRLVEASDNLFEDITTGSTGTNIFTGIQLGADVTTVNSFNGNKADRNTFYRCGNSNPTYPGLASFGIIIVGQDSQQVGNVARDNYWFEPFYMKGNSNSQIGNKCHNNQHSGVSMKIMLDTNESRLCVQDGNVVTGQCDIRPAIRMFGSGRSINSQVNITTTAQVDVQGGWGYQATRSSTTDGELYITGSFDAPKGMILDTAGDVTIDARIDSASTGIQITKSTDDELRSVRISGKIYSVDQAINVNYCRRLELNNLDIECLRSDGDAIFAFVEDQAIIDGGKLVSYHTGTLPQLISLYAMDGGNLASCKVTVSDYTIAARQPITYIFRVFGGSDPYRLTLSNVDFSNTGDTRYLIRALSGLESISLYNNNINYSGTALTRTIDAGGQTISDVIIQNNLMNYVATDDIANHTNATVTRSRVNDNKTS